MSYTLVIHCVFVSLISRTAGQLDIVTEDTPLAERGACISNPCLHRGMCTVTSSGFICTCINGYIGINCERRADDCPLDLSMPCVHGVCKLDMKGHPRCHCTEGFEGPECSIQLDNCASFPCQNGGICIDKVNGYDCKCPTNTDGSHCQIKKQQLQKCLATCGQHYFDGKCWHQGNSPISVGWGLGEYICSTRRSCFNATELSTDSLSDDEDYIIVQLKPVQMQETDELVFITDRDARLYDHRFVPHILPMEANSEQAFLSCNTTNAIPLTNNPSISRLNVNESLLNIGTQYFLANMNELYRCKFGLRLNVTVKTQHCIDPDVDISLNSEFCNGRGKCFTDFTRSSYECLCCQGYAGEYCQHEDPCHAKPCMNGGTCQLLNENPLNRQCRCPSGYHGKQCEKKINFCDSLPCQNNGICYPELSDYRCQCKDGFSGKSCQVNHDECASSPCKNGATCRDGLNNFHCDCHAGYKGTLCEVDINECERQPCVNSTCLDLINNYTCACTPGSTGRNCDVLLSECASQPCVNGKCVQEKNGFSCSCGIGYTGMLCELKLDLCLYSQYCIIAHAQKCLDHGDNVTCSCANGWGGSNCGVNINECGEHNCKNGAKCIDRLNGYDCKCKKGYSGLYCEVAPMVIIPDIEISFMADDCTKFENAQEVRHLEENIIALLRNACQCPLTQNGIQQGSSTVACEDNMAGVFKSELMVDGGTEYKEDIICGMIKKIETENTPYIYHNTYIVGIKDYDNLCSDVNKRTVDAKAEENSSTTGTVIGVLIAFVIIIAVFTFVSLKIRKWRNFKVGVTTHKFSSKISFDNASYITKEDSLDETSFMSRDSTMEQQGEEDEHVMECPRWADSYDRARKLYERNRSNIPVGRLFDIQKPGGESSVL